MSKNYCFWGLAEGPRKRGTHWINFYGPLTFRQVFSYNVDLSLMNLFLGLDISISKHVSLWQRKSIKFNTYKLRTFEEISQWNPKWKEACWKKKDANNFYNCINVGGIQLIGLIFDFVLHPSFILWKMQQKRFLRNCPGKKFGIESTYQ